MYRILWTLPAVPVLAAVLLAPASRNISATAGEGDFSGRRFRYTKFNGCRFDRCSFDRCSVSNSTGNGLEVSHSEFRSAVFDNVELYRPRFDSARISRAEYAGGRFEATLSGVDIPGLQLYRCSVRSQQLRYSDIGDLNCESVDVGDVSARNVDISDGRFQGVGLDGADLSRVELSRADIRGSTFEDATMSGCDLSDVRASNCNLRGARFERCEIRGLTINGYDIERLIERAEDR